MPNKYSITRKIECDIGHRIPDHQSKCKNVHGHRYTVEATCTSYSLIKEGASKDMVLDFTFLKEEMVEVIDKCCDHALVLSKYDPLLQHLLIKESRPLQQVEGTQWTIYITDFGRLYVIDASPTAEVLAEHWYNRLAPRVEIRSSKQAHLQSIKVYETPNCWAVYPV